MNLIQLVRKYIVLSLLIFVSLFKFNDLKAREKKPKFVLDFKSCIKSGQDIMDDILMTNQAYFYIEYEKEEIEIKGKRKRRYTYTICKNNYKSEKLAENQYLKKSDWVQNYMVYSKERDELILTQLFVPGYPQSNYYKLSVFDKNLKLKNKISIDFEGKRFVAFTVYKEYFNFYLNDSKSLYFYSYDRQGKIVEKKDLKINTNPQDLYQYGKSYKGSIVLCVESTIGKSLQKDLENSNATVKERLDNYIIDEKLNNPTNLFIYVFDKCGNLEDRKMLPRRNNDGIVSIYHWGNQKYYIGILCNFFFFF